ncbi:MAG: neutral/alkaline non-lysosomal ceramidase N-terminal domain-containing protein [Oscillospiraceae bacterium]|nr:neutral/alkaline non-lysosomal ceramidase N-terminal domain-containing protein [Oscillospiraceae bacterium]
MSNIIKCGAAELVITPALGLMIPGQFAPTIAGGVKDDLFVKAIIFDDDENKIVMISMDIIGVTEAMTVDIRNRINDMTGIPQKNIMVAVTHTHTGSPTGLVLYSNLPDNATVKNICNKAADAAVLANKNLQNAAVGYGVADEWDVGFNRRFYMKDGTARTNPGFLNPDIVKQAGPVDPSVNVIRVDNECGEPIAVMVNFACHLDVVGGNEYSADYPGEMSRVIKKALGENVVVLFFNGCCGDINHLDFTKERNIGPEHYKKMGRILAGDVIAIREKITCSHDITVDAASEIVTGKRRQPSVKQYEAAKEYLASGAPAVDLKIIAQAHVNLTENPLLTRDIEIQTLRIGDIGISAFPSETFVEIGLAIKADSPFKNNFTIELANGCCGYVATEKAFAEGGYEVGLSEYTYMSEDTDKLVEKTAIKLLKEVI